MKAKIIKNEIHLESYLSEHVLRVRIDQKGAPHVEVTLPKPGPRKFIKKKQNNTDLP